MPYSHRTCQLCSSCEFKDWGIATVRMERIASENLNGSPQTQTSVRMALVWCQAIASQLSLKRSCVLLLNFILFYFEGVLSYNVWWMTFEQVDLWLSFMIVTVEQGNPSFVNPQLCILSALIWTVFMVSKLYLWLIDIPVGAVIGIDAALWDVLKISSHS